MKIFSISNAALLAAFYSISLLPSGKCNEMVHEGVRGNSKDLNLNQGNSALYGTVITSQEEASSTAYNDAFEKVLRLLRQRFDQVATGLVYDEQETSSVRNGKSEPDLRPIAPAIVVLDARFEGAFVVGQVNPRASAEVLCEHVHSSMGPNNETFRRYEKLRTRKLRRLLNPLLGLCPFYASKKEAAFTTWKGWENHSDDLGASTQYLNFLNENSYAKNIKVSKGENVSSKTHQLNRRSAAETQEDEESHGTRVPDSGFSKQPSNPNGKQSTDPRDESVPVFSPADGDENQHSASYPRMREVYTPTANFERDSFLPSLGIPLEIKLEEFLDDYQSRYGNRHLLNLFPLGRLEDIRLGLPGQPIRRILHQIFERLAARTKPTDVDQQSNPRFLRKLFADGRSLVDTVRANRETGEVGIHKALNLGPLSVKFDVGRS